MGKGKTLLFNVVLNLVLALVIFFNAQLGKSLGIAGEILPVSLVWLPTGLSLAALLLFGQIAWPGIFLGNLAHNMHQIYMPHDMMALVGAITISLGSLLQALVAYKIMRRYSSPNYLSSVKDVMIFLIPAGILTCLIACTVGVLVMNALTPLNFETLRHVWVTFWIGDTFGVYLLTPLLVVWTLLPPIGWSKERVTEAILMVVSFIALTYLIDYTAYPMYHFYILLNIWVAYRFGLRGVTLALFLIGLAIIIPFTLGFGFFNRGFVPNPLLAIVLFLEVLVMISLIVGAISRERHIANEELKKLHINLKQCVEYRNAQNEISKGEASIKTKLFSIGFLVQGLTRLLEIPMKRINVFARNSLGILDKTDMDPEAKYTNIKNFLEGIVESENRGHEIILAIERQAARDVSLKKIPLSELLKRGIDQALARAHKKYPALSVLITEELDNTIEIFTPVPEHFSEAISNLLLLRIQKLEREPHMAIRSSDLKNHFEVVIEDNGRPISHEEAEQLSSLSHKKQTIEDLDITLAHDTIAVLYQGVIEAHTDSNGLNLITIIFPKG